MLRVIQVERRGSRFDRDWPIASAPTAIRRSRTIALLDEIPLKEKRLLDVGCGTGWFSSWAADQGADVVAIDGRLPSLSHPRIELERAALPHLPFLDESFDLICCFDLIGQIPKQEQRLALSELRRLLRPGGRLLFSTPIDRKTKRALERLESIVSSEFEIEGWILSSLLLRGDRVARGLEWIVERIAPRWGVTHAAMSAKKKAGDCLEARS